MSRSVVGCWIGAGAFAAAAAAAAATAAACGSFDDGDTPSNAPDASGDAPSDGPSSTTDGGDGDGQVSVDADAQPQPGTVEVLTTTITTPWYLAEGFGNVLVVTSRATGVGGGVFRVPKNPGGMTTRIGLRPAFGVATAGPDVWYCSDDATDLGLVHVPLAGGANTALTNVKCIEVATFNGEIYTTGSERDVVEHVFPDGGLEAFQADEPEGIAVDDTGIYWAELHGQQIGVKRPSSDAATTVATGIGPEPRRIAIKNGYVYWVEFQTDKVQRIKQDGSGGKQQIATGPAATSFGGIAVDLLHVYWVVSRDKADGGPGGGVYRVPRGGGLREAVIENLDLPVDVAIDNDFVYVTVMNENKVLRIAK